MGGIREKNNTNLLFTFYLSPTFKFVATCHARTRVIDRWTEPTLNEVDNILLIFPLCIHIVRYFDVAFLHLCPNTSLTNMQTCVSRPEQMEQMLLPPPLFFSLLFCFTWLCITWMQAIRGGRKEAAAAAAAAVEWSREHCCCHTIFSTRVKTT